MEASIKAYSKAALRARSCLCRNSAFWRPRNRARCTAYEAGTCSRASVSSGMGGWGVIGSVGRGVQGSTGPYGGMTGGRGRCERWFGEVVRSEVGEKSTAGWWWGSEAAYQK